MTRNFMRVLAVTTALTAAFPAFAQGAEDGAEAGDDAIIVTARRDAENAQDVPVSMQVVTGSRLQDLAITSVEEVSKLAPGLTLINAGSSTLVVLRGVTWQPGSGTPATPIYFNEVPFDPGNTIVSMFDVGQIEVLRGPQGTTRGAPSISGAVTLTTRKPDLDEFGGYIQGLYGSGDHWDVQGAVNVPIIKDVLAVRLAGNVEDSDGLRIYSVNSTIQPKFKDRTFRASMLLKPTSTLTFEAMYQRRKSLAQNYTQVAGTGSPGRAALGIAPNFNGPALTTRDRASVQDRPSVNRQHIDLLTVNASWEVFGQKLSYNFGRQFNRSPATFNANDPLNIVPGFEPFTSPDNQSLPKWRSHEIRISSMPDPDRPFDYDIGWFSKHSGGTIVFSAPVFLPGAFGPPFLSVPGQVTTPNPRNVLNSTTNIQIGQVFDSFYGNLRFHIDDRTELSGGLAILRDRVPVILDITTTQTAVTFPNFLPPQFGGCPAPGFLPPSPDYGPAFCEVTVPARVFPTEAHNDKYTAAIYNFSLSHKFSDDVLVYASHGSSFRTGLPAINNTGLPSDLLVPNPEKAKSYELGVKTSFGRRLRINAAVFQLDYKNQLTTFEGVNFFSTVPGAGIRQTSIAFYRNINARVRGFELEIAAEPVDDLQLGVNLSYSKIKSKGGLVPCNDPTRPINAANPINFCQSPKGETLNTQAPFQATINGSYNVPISGSIEGYLRFNVNYQGKNPNFGNFRQANGSFTQTRSYAVVDLFAGLTGDDSAWDVGFYAKNLFNKQVELARVLTTNSVYALFAAPPGYDVVRSSRPREIGVSVRYAIGSR